MNFAYGFVLTANWLSYFLRDEANDLDREEVMKMVEERDKHITELQYSIVNLKEEKELLSQKFR